MREVTCCPDCKSTMIRKHTRKANSFMCYKCGLRFRKPATKIPNRRGFFIKMREKTEPNTI